MPENIIPITQGLTLSQTLSKSGLSPFVVNQLTNLGFSIQGKVINDHLATDQFWHIFKMVLLTAIDWPIVQGFKL
ncbi:MAG TPA: hypothetical protein DCR40_02450 [Prolixibacteraceae bacterium]|nr:hypothetical protein [Prolixibacteraceae bacterium]